MSMFEGGNPEGGANSTSGRRPDLDWLRVFAVLAVFVYHSTRFFNLGDWHVKNGTTYAGVEVWNIFATRWLMPLFFLLSGAALFFALERTSGLRRFLRDRTLRLLVPLVVAVFSHSAVQVYLERRSHGLFAGPFFDFLPHYFDGVYLEIGGSGNFAFHGMHLWYLLFLFFYGLMLYPLFRGLLGRGRRTLEAAGNLLAVPGMIYVLFPLPFFLMNATIDEGVLRVGNGGWGFLYYPWFMVSGFLIMGSVLLQRAIVRQRRLSLALGTILSIAYFLVRSAAIGGAEGTELRHAADSIYSFVGGWALLLAILGYGMRYLRSESPFLQYASEAGIAFYILHQTVMLCVGFLVVDRPLSDAGKWLLILVTSFAYTLGLYEVAVRRVNVLRVLFGMKPTAPVGAHLPAERDSRTGVAI